jgi:F-box interacting protein
MAHLEHVPPCTLLFSPSESILGTLRPSDSVIFDEAWSPSTWAAPVIGPDDLLCGTCNGLLCLHTPTSTLKIANLATGECLHLKKPTKSLKDDHFSFYRFGFHPVTKEYKVIHFCQEIGPFTEDRFNVIQVYTLGDEKWKDIVTPEALSLNCVKKSGVVIVDGTMYWLIEDGGSNWKHALMSFDLGEGSFAQIQLPAVELEDWAFGDGRKYWVIEINGKVCVSTAHSMDGMLICKLQIWALNGAGDQRWSHMYSIQLSSTFARRLHFVNGDKLLIQHRDNNLYSYELLGMNFKIEFSKMVKLLGLRPWGDDDLQLYTCVKSLVRLDLYANAAVVRHPKMQGRWKLKKWKAWQYKDFKLEEMLRNLYQIELDMLVYLLIPVILDNTCYD